MTENPTGGDEEGPSSRETAQRIAALNDDLRVNGRGDKLMMTYGVQALGEERVAKIIQEVQRYDAFTSDNDPYGEHRTGEIKVDGDPFYWVIDYYDPSCPDGVRDPADPTKTTRTLTVKTLDEALWF